MKKYGLVRKYMDLLEDLRMSLLTFNFVMIHIICKILVMITNHLNYLKK